MLHPRADVQRIYLPRRFGGRGLISLEECVREEEIGLAYYIQNNEEPLLRTVLHEGVFKKIMWKTLSRLKEEEPDREVAI